MLIGNLKVYGIIYKITNLINNKVYIGQTSIGFEKRYHSNLQKYTHNKHLKSAISKYGINNFLISNIDVAFSKEELSIKEKMWIQLYKSYSEGYNYTLGGEGISGLPREMHGMYGTHRIGDLNPFYGMKHTKLTKLKISHCASLRIGILNPNYGNGDRIKGTNNPMYGISPQERMDEETYKHWREKKLLATQGKNNPNSKSVINITTGEIFDYIKDAIKVYGEIAISACCRGKVKTAGKCKWAYHKEYIKLTPTI